MQNNRPNKPTSNIPPFTAQQSVGSKPINDVNLQSSKQIPLMGNYQPNVPGKSTTLSTINTPVATSGSSMVPPTSTTLPLLGGLPIYHNHFQSNQPQQHHPLETPAIPISGPIIQHHKTPLEYQSTHSSAPHSQQSYTTMGQSFSTGSFSQGPLYHQQQQGLGQQQQQQQQQRQFHLPINLSSGQPSLLSALLNTHHQQQQQQQQQPLSSVQPNRPNQSSSTASIAGPINTLLPTSSTGTRTPTGPLSVPNGSLLPLRPGSGPSPTKVSKKKKQASTTTTTPQRSSSSMVHLGPNVLPSSTTIGLPTTTGGTTTTTLTPQANSSLLATLLHPSPYMHQQLHQPVLLAPQLQQQPPLTPSGSTTPSLQATLARTELEAIITASPVFPFAVATYNSLYSPKPIDQHWLLTIAEINDLGCHHVNKKIHDIIHASEIEASKLILDDPLVLPRSTRRGGGAAHVKTDALSTGSSTSSGNTSTMMSTLHQPLAPRPLYQQQHQRYGGDDEKHDDEYLKTDVRSTRQHANTKSIQPSLVSSTVQPTANIVNINIQSDLLHQHSNDNNQQSIQAQIDALPSSKQQLIKNHQQAHELLIMFLIYIRKIHHTIFTLNQQVIDRVATVNTMLQPLQVQYESQLSNISQPNQQQHAPGQPFGTLYDLLQLVKSSLKVSHADYFAHDVANQHDVYDKRGNESLDLADLYRGIDQSLQQDGKK